MLVNNDAASASSPSSSNWSAAAFISLAISALPATFLIKSVLSWPFSLAVLTIFPTSTMLVNSDAASASAPSSSNWSAAAFISFAMFALPATFFMKSVLSWPFSLAVLTIFPTSTIFVKRESVSAPSSRSSIVSTADFISTATFAFFATFLIKSVFDLPLDSATTTTSVTASIFSKRVRLAEASTSSVDTVWVTFLKSEARSGLARTAPRFLVAPSSLPASTTSTSDSACSENVKTPSKTSSLISAPPASLISSKTSTTFTTFDIWSNELEILNSSIFKPA